jgi:hypothetical protein
MEKSQLLLGELYGRIAEQRIGELGEMNGPIAGQRMGAG